MTTSNPSGSDPSNTDSGTQSNGISVLFGSPQLLSRDMSKLVNRKLFREKIFGHKCILSARNPMFRQLFVAEADRVSFDIRTVKPVTFLLLLYFLYTNSISFDRLDIYEVFDVMKTAEQYNCDELASLSEIQVGGMLDPKTAFELLSPAIQMGREFIRGSAIEYIEEYSSAMKAILENEAMDLDRMRSVDVARFWAMSHVQRARDCVLSENHEKARISLINIPMTPEESTQSSSDLTTPNATHEQITAVADQATQVQQAYSDVAWVMSSLRLEYLQPNDLARIEEAQLEERFIPQECFVKAWRLMATHNTSAPQDTVSERRYTVNPTAKANASRVNRRKSYADPNKRGKSIYN